MWSRSIPRCFALVFSLSACHSAVPSPPAPEPPLREGCNPLGGAADEDCLLPFQSTYFTVKDGTTPTGVRVALPAALLPANAQGVRIDPTPQNRQDGFSAASALLVYFPTRLAGDDLPGPGDLAKTVTADSPVQLLRFDTGERVPLFAELDANAHGDARQALILRPAERLQPSTRYVAMIRGLHAAGGADLAPLSGFGSLRDDTTEEGSVRHGERARYEEIFAFLGSAGIPRGTLQLAWDFTTASDASLQGRLLRMRDEAAAYQAPSPPPAVTFTTVTELPAELPDLQRRILGTFTVPSYLTDDDFGGFDAGPDGEPTIRGYGQFPLAIHVPACASTATLPLPVMIYGHGSYSTAAKEMATDYQREIINRLCVVEVGTDWIGRAVDDAQFLASSLVMDANQYAIPTERIQQAQVNVLTLARLIRAGGLSALPDLALGGKPLVDASRVYYYGISEGGIQGGTFLALTPDVDRGALNVPCGFWSSFFWRSSDFSLFFPGFQDAYADPLDLQVTVAMTQPLWDYSDPATYAAHLLRDPLAGSTAKKVLYQEGHYDASVPNQNTRAMVRSMGMKLLRPVVEPVFGVDEADGPQDSAYTQFDIGASPLGQDDVPPATTDTHETIRTLEPVKQQLQMFLREGGQVVETCGGKPCTGLMP
jgi:hypothetical protein